MRPQKTINNQNQPVELHFQNKNNVELKTLYRYDETAGSLHQSTKLLGVFS